MTALDAAIAAASALLLSIDPENVTVADRCAMLQTRIRVDVARIAATGECGGWSGERYVNGRALPKNPR